MTYEGIDIYPIFESEEAFNAMVSSNGIDEIVGRVVERITSLGEDYDIVALHRIITPDAVHGMFERIAKLIGNAMIDCPFGDVIDSDWVEEMLYDKCCQSDVLFKQVADKVLDMTINGGGVFTMSRFTDEEREYLIKNVKYWPISDYYKYHDKTVLVLDDNRFNDGPISEAALAIKLTYVPKSVSVISLIAKNADASVPFLNLDKEAYDRFMKRYKEYDTNYRATIAPNH